MSKTVDVAASAELSRARHTLRQIDAIVETGLDRIKDGTADPDPAVRLRRIKAALAGDVHAHDYEEWVKRGRPHVWVGQIPDGPDQAQGNHTTSPCTSPTPDGIVIEQGAQWCKTCGHVLLLDDRNKWRHAKKV